MKQDLKLSLALLIITIVCCLLFLAEVAEKLTRPGRHWLSRATFGSIGLAGFGQLPY